MTQRQQFGDAILYCGDCREIIPKLTAPITAVVSDPPYGTAELTGGKGYRRTQQQGSGAVLSIANDNNLDCCFEALSAIEQRFTNLRMITFFSPRVAPDFYQRAGLAKLPFVDEVVWDKKMPSLGWAELRYQHENIAIFEFGTPPPPAIEMLSVLPYVRNAELHPHQKPIVLMQTLCDYANGDYVLDPFMGSGSTGVAALASKRKFIGIELDPQHFDTACHRMEEASKLETLF